MLKASRDAGVKRVVMTSSMAAIAYGRGARAEPFSEADWTDETNRNDTSAYERSKTIAERAAWAWREAEGRALELVTVNPALVLGPVLGSDFSASLEAIKKLLDGSVPALPRFGFSLVDVRDIAQLHLLAMTAPAAAGRRFLGSAEFYWMKDMAKILKQGLGDKARKVPSISIPDFLVRLFAVFDPVVRTRLFELGKRRLVSSDKARRVLGWKRLGRSQRPFSTPPGACRRRAWLKLRASREDRSPDPYELSAATWGFRVSARQRSGGDDGSVLQSTAMEDVLPRGQSRSLCPPLDQLLRSSRVTPSKLRM